MKQLLVEKYRPKTIQEYVFQNEAMKQQCFKWIHEGIIPNLLFIGPAGCGKSTISGMLVNELGLNSIDVKRVNASLVSGIGFIREELEPWLKKRPFGKYKVVQLEELDRLSRDAQMALRNVAEEFSGTARFIATANYESGIIDAMHSRFQTTTIDTMDYDGVLGLVCDILEKEGTSFNDDADLLSHIDAYQPDIRKIINSIDQHTTSGNVLQPLKNASYGGDIAEWENIWSNGNVVKQLDDVIALTELVDQSNYTYFYDVAAANHQQFEDQVSGIIKTSKYLDRAQTTTNHRLTLKAFLFEAFLLEE